MPTSPIIGGNDILSPETRRQFLDRLKEGWEALDTSPVEEKYPVIKKRPYSSLRI